MEIPSNADANNAEADAERRESITDIMASWALEGMEPTPEGLARVRAYVAGKSLSTKPSQKRKYAMPGAGDMGPPPENDTERDAAQSAAATHE